MPRYRGIATRTSHRSKEFEVEADTAAAARDKMLRLSEDYDYTQANECYADHEVDVLEEVK